MATATKKVDAARSVARAARGVSESSSLEFVVYRANGGDYKWEIIGQHGESLALSGGFASYDDAEGAAWRVHEGAGSARFEPRVAEERQLGAA